MPNIKPFEDKPFLVRVLCPQCGGAKTLRAPIKPLPTTFQEFEQLPNYDEPIKTKLVSCPTCKGLGDVLPRFGSRAEIWQGNKCVGTCMIPLRVHESPLVVHRVFDYTPEARGPGKMIYKAALDLGPGDFEALEGFEPVNR